MATHEIQQNNTKFHLPDQLFPLFDRKFRPPFRLPFFINEQRTCVSSGAVPRIEPEVGLSLSSFRNMKNMGKPVVTSRGL